MPPAASSAETEAARNLKVTFGHDYSNGPQFFPDITAPYRQIKIDPLVLTNSPRIQHLIKDGKLLLSLDDAITLAIENNLGINIARYTPWEAETDVLRAKSGQQIFRTAGDRCVIRFCEHSVHLVRSIAYGEFQYCGRFDSR